MSYSLGHPTPRSWLINRMTAACVTTFCAPTHLSPGASLTRSPALIFAFRSIGFAGECLGQHSGSNQAANLGDGHGYRASTIVLSQFVSLPSLISSFLHITK